jgi:hypothetical protein
VRHDNSPEERETTFVRPDKTGIGQQLLRRRGGFRHKTS